MFMPIYFLFPAAGSEDIRRDKSCFGTGFGTNREWQILYSMTMPVFSDEIDETIEMLSTTSDLWQSRDQIRYTSGKKLRRKIQHIIFKELAEKGIDNILDVFIKF